MPRPRKLKHCKKVKTQISILVPFQSTDPFRLKVWVWLHQYLSAFLPDAEIIVGRDPKSKKRPWRRHPKPFSKTVAMNNAFNKSHGDIIVILDADAYLDTNVITQCAERIRLALKVGIHLWFVPYSHLYRLTEDATLEVLESNPADPLRFTTPPDPFDVETLGGEGYGHKWGALCQIMPRSAFHAVEGGDERFRGWGGEDSSLMRAVSTLWGRPKFTTNQILHLWHPRLKIGKGSSPFRTRVWAEQEAASVNDHLYGQYLRANGNREKMYMLTRGYDLP